jgi:hypothetical protein
MGDMRGDGSTFGYGGLDSRIGQYHAKEGSSLPWTWNIFSVRKMALYIR